MSSDDQQAVIDWLASADTHGAPVDRIDTHTAVVFLTGDRAYKLKRAVQFDYVDFSTAELRRACCEAEVRLNRRTAPDLYRGVVPVTRDAAGVLSFGGTGTAVDWVVEMSRFPQQAVFDRLAADGRLDVALMEPLARAIAQFHLEAEPRRDHGGKHGMAWVVDGNAEGFAQFGAACLDQDDARTLTAAARQRLDEVGNALDARREAGLVRHCHGDLHLRNIVLLDAAPTLFDGVEFNDRIACTDVLYDLAFLLMDLWRRRLPRHANAVWNAYLDEAGIGDGLDLLPLFLSCRAAVRAKTSATAATQQAAARDRAPLESLAREYLAMAQALLRPPPPLLLAIGGLSGTGKSTLAFGLAPVLGAVPGAVVVRSDVVRKRQHGVPLHEHLGDEAYTDEASDRVYGALIESASGVLRQGHSVIVDAVHARAGDRDAIARAADAAGAAFVGIWLDADPATLVDRVDGRAHNPSDADAAVIGLQQRHDTGPIAWQRIDASGAADEVRGSALAHLRAVAAQGLNDAAGWPG